MHLPISYVISSVEQKGVPNSCANLINNSLERDWTRFEVIFIIREYIIALSLCRNIHFFAASFTATHRFFLDTEFPGNGVRLPGQGHLPLVTFLWLLKNKDEIPGQKVFDAHDFKPGLFGHCGVPFSFGRSGNT
jgi:hypothetical protein